ncbi:MAG: hypothetical protein WBZ36_13500 [Candidatus Nitrosopolaris sp.]
MGKYIIFLQTYCLNADNQLELVGDNEIAGDLRCYVREQILQSQSKMKMNTYWPIVARTVIILTVLTEQNSRLSASEIAEIITIQYGDDDKMYHLTYLLYENTIIKSIIGRVTLNVISD